MVSVPPESNSVRESPVLSTMYVSFPEPPVMVSSPAPPFKILFPIFPVKILSLELPVASILFEPLKVTLLILFPSDQSVDDDIVSAPKTM